MRTILLRTLILAGAAVTLSGCISLFPEAEPAKLYRFEIAAPPAHLGEVRERLAVQGASTSHLLERRARQGQETAAKVHARQARIGASLADHGTDHDEWHGRRTRLFRGRALDDPEGRSCEGDRRRAGGS